MNKVIAVEEKGIGAWSKTSRALKVALPYVNGRFLLDSLRFLWLMDITIDRSTPPRQFYLERYYKMLIDYLAQPELEGSALGALVRYPIENQGISKWVRSEILSWLSRKCVDDPKGAFSVICCLVDSGYFDPKEVDALRNILGINVNEIQVDDITENVAKITGAILWNYLHHDFSRLMNRFFPPDSGKQVGPLLPLIAKICGKLDRSKINSVIENKNAQIGFDLANQTVEQGRQHLTDLTTIGYFSQEGGEIMREISVYITDFNLAKIQNGQEREKVAEIAIGFLMERLRKSCAKSIPEKNAELLLIAKVFQGLGSYVQLPWILKEVMDIFPQDMDSVKTIIRPLGSPSAEHIPALLEIARGMAQSNKHFEEAKIYPLILLANDSTKPTINQLNSLIQTLRSDEKEFTYDTVLELIRRMDSGAAAEAIPDLIKLVKFKSIDVLKKILLQIGSPLEQDRERIREHVNNFTKNVKEAELATLSLSQMSPTVDDINAIIGLKDGPPRLRIACAQALSTMRVEENPLVFETLKELAVDIEVSVRKAALQALHHLNYINEKLWSVATDLFLIDSISMSADSWQIVKNSRLLELCSLYVRNAFTDTWNHPGCLRGYINIYQVLTNSGLWTPEDAKFLAGFMIDDNLKDSGFSAMASASVREFLGVDGFAIPKELPEEKCLTNRLANLSFFGTDGLKSAVELLCKMYEEDPKKITRERLDILAGMGIHLEENDFEDFYKLFRNNHWLAGIDPKKVTFNTIPLLWSGDPGEFMRAELKKLKAGLNIFTGPLAKTLMNKMLIMPETAIDKDEFVPAFLIKEIFRTERDIRKLETRSSNKKEADNRLMKSLSETLRDAGFYDFILLPR